PGHHREIVAQTLKHVPTMKKVLLLILSHTAVLSAGYAVHRMAMDTQTKHTAPAKDVSPPPRTSPAGTLPAARSGDDRKALSAVRASNLNDQQKQLLRNLILKDWMARDPHSALRALTEEG